MVIELYSLLFPVGSKDVIIEGDIVVSPRLAKVLLSQQESEKDAKKSEENPVQPWIDGVVPYKFSSDIGKGPSIVC